MIKILFIDTSALLSFFISDKGTSTMRWLMSSDNKKHNITRYVINNQVIEEFEKKLIELVSRDEIKQTTADNILSLFNSHYKNQRFKIVGKNASVTETLNGMYNFLGGISRPLLVTSNTQRIDKASEYKTINPRTQTPKEIECILKGKTPKPEKREKINFYKRIFNKPEWLFH